MHCKETKFGFEYGAAKVERNCSDKVKGWVSIGIITPKHEGHNEIQVYVTKTGKVRIFTGKTEWKPGG